MKQELNPQKYVDQINEIEEQAQKATIELLKNNPNGRYIHRWDIPDEVDDDGFFDTYTGDDKIINIHSVGLDDNDRLVFKGDTVYGDSLAPGDWFEFDEWTSGYAKAYKFVAMYLEYAKENREEDDV